MKLEERHAAIVLRKKGWMLPAISKRLKVSRSTISLWLRDVQFNERQQEKLLAGRDRSRFCAGLAKKNARIKTTRRLFEEGRIEALSRVADSFFVAGAMLYWAEGAKTTESIKFSNSDPVMIRFMMRWFREICSVPEHKFRICIHGHELHTRNDIESYWSEITEVPRSRFYKTQIKKTSLGQRRNKLYEGTCSIAIGNKNLFRKMQGWKAGILENLGQKAR